MRSRRVTTSGPWAVRTCRRRPSGRSAPVYCPVGLLLLRSWARSRQRRDHLRCRRAAPRRGKVPGRCSSSRSVCLAPSHWRASYSAMGSSTARVPGEPRTAVSPSRCAVGSSPSRVAEAAFWSFVHIEDAAAATLAALTRGARGAYNVADDEPVASCCVAAHWLGASAPAQVSADDVKKTPTHASTPCSCAAPRTPRSSTSSASDPGDANGSRTRRWWVSRRFLHGLDGLQDECLDETAVEVGVRRGRRSILNGDILLVYPTGQYANARSIRNARYI